MVEKGSRILQRFKKNTELKYLKKLFLFLNTRSSKFIFIYIWTKKNDIFNIRYALGLTGFKGIRIATKKEVVDLVWIFLSDNLLDPVLRQTSSTKHSTCNKKIVTIYGLKLKMGLWLTGEQVKAFMGYLVWKQLHWILMSNCLTHLRETIKILSIRSKTVVLKCNKK